MSGLSSDTWSALFAGVSTAVVVVGAIIAIRQLRIVAKTNRLQAYEFFLDCWTQTHDGRRFILEEFVFDPAALPEPGSETAEHIRTVINKINEIGFIVERRILPPKYVLSVIYADLIRLHVRLQPYLDAREKELGFHYGRRVGRLADQARTWMCVRPALRSCTVRTRMPPGPDYAEIYRVPLRRGMSGVMQRCGWLGRRLLARY